MPPDDPRTEQPGPYFVPDLSRAVERVRLHLLYRLITARMGGVLLEQEQEDLSRVRRVLDVGCGAGGWLIRTAINYSSIQLLVGVDVSDRLVQHAREQVELHKLDKDRVQFATMDVLHRLVAPFSFFDLINQRLSVGWLRIWEWDKLLQEYQRVGSQGCILRITEPEMAPSTCSSQALSRLFDLVLQAFHQAGHLFAPERDGLTSQLPALLEKHGFQQIQTRVHSIAIDSSTGSDEAQQGREVLRYLFRTILPFLRHWTEVPDNYEELYQQAMSDIADPSFQSTSRLVTVWAVMPAPT